MFFVALSYKIAVKCNSGRCYFTIEKTQKYGYFGKTLFRCLLYVNAD